MHLNICIYFTKSLHQKLQKKLGKNAKNKLSLKNSSRLTTEKQKV